MIILDTHAWIWWVAEPRRLSARARRTIEGAPEVGVCSISCWELAMLVSRGRLQLDRDVLLWVRQALALPSVVLLPLTPEIAVRAAGFDQRFPGDPADRMIAGSAIEYRAPLVTKDRRLRSFGEVGCLW